VDEGSEIQAKTLGNLVNEIIAENFPNLHNNLGTLVHEAFQTPSRHDQKRTIPFYIIIKMLNLRTKREY
jgi:hypothetical protein